MIERHWCKGKLPKGGYGPAITECIEVGNESARYPEHKVGQFWAGNDEYDSQVNYCSYCGAKALVQVGE